MADERILDKDKLRAITSDLDDALKALMEKHGLRELRCGRGTFDPHAGSFHFKVEGVVGGGLGPEASMYEVERQYDKELPALGTSFRDSTGKAHVITGANKNGKVLTQSGGKSFVWRDRRGLVACLKKGGAQE